MGRPGIQMWTWTRCGFFSCVGRALAGPQYMVAIPATLEAGAEAKFCASLLQPNETLVMTVTLKSSEADATTLLTRTSNTEFHMCTEFEVPLRPTEEVQNFEVEVRGNTFYSKEVQKVLIEVYHPKTFVQTDKPIYLPGQTVHFRVITLDSKLRPANGLYNIIEIADPNNNRIGQWLNQTANSKILQLSYDLNSEARIGMYQVIVTIGLEKIHHNFKVEKYVLPKFDVKINASSEVSIDQEEIKAEVCATYTFGQAVPGSVEVEMCRPLNNYYRRSPINPSDLQGIPDVVATRRQSRWTTKAAPHLSSQCQLSQKVLQDDLQIRAKVEEGTGISRQQDQRITISYIVGKLSFTDTPKIYDEGSNVEGKVQAVHYNNTPIPNMPLYLFEGERRSSHRLQNLTTTNNNGVATFSFSTVELNGDIQLHVGSLPTYGYPGYRTPYYEAGDHTVLLVRLSTPHTQTVSSLKLNNNPLPCDTEEKFTINTLW
ncbi:hypothetical protein VZT92_005776 [Zoarces viviparus]|uniref:Alpha-2-macroglobulin n=1 Tax=Zoarces viviparus TaxID=48416 RepID=A0AAW1FMB7_ZOAVI